jgi:hypothetical protein
VTGLDDDGEDTEADLMGSFRTNGNRQTHLTTTALLQLTSDVIKFRVSPLQPETFRTAWIVWTIRPTHTVHERFRIRQSIQCTAEYPIELLCRRTA